MVVEDIGEGGNIKKKDAHESVCWNITDSRNKYKSMKNKAKKAFPKARRDKAKKALTECKI